MYSWPISTDSTHNGQTRVLLLTLSAVSMTPYESTNTHVSFSFIYSPLHTCVLYPVCGTYPGRRRKDAAPPPMLFPCPSCQQEVELGEKGLADCLRNLTLERIVERYT